MASKVMTLRWCEKSKLLKSIKAPQMGRFFALDPFIYEMRRANTRQESWRIKLVSLGVHGETFSLIGVV